MSKTKHTAGPWEARKALHPSDGGWDWGIAADVGGKQRCIAEAFEVVGRDVKAPAEANARLIAAAPDLLDVCAFFDVVEKDGRVWLNVAGVTIIGVAIRHTKDEAAALRRLGEMQRAAIARAEGRS